MNEQELSTEHLRQLHERMGLAITNREWQSLIEMASEMEMVASKQATDDAKIGGCGRYGKR